MEFKCPLCFFLPFILHMSSISYLYFELSVLCCLRLIVELFVWPSKRCYFTFVLMSSQETNELVAIKKFKDSEGE